MYPTDEHCWLHRNVPLLCVEFSDGQKVKQDLYCPACGGPSHPAHDPEAAAALARYERQLDRRWFWRRLMSRPARHVTTDPACARHRPPRTWWQRWRFGRGRGFSCLVCMPKRVTFDVTSTWVTLDNTDATYTPREPLSPLYEPDDAGGQNSRG